MKKPAFEKEWNVEAYQLRFNQSWAPFLHLPSDRYYQFYVATCGDTQMRVSGQGPTKWLDNQIIDLTEFHPVYIQLPPIYWPLLEQNGQKFKDDQIKAVVTIKKMVKSYQQGVSQNTYKVWNPQIKLIDVSKVVPKFVDNGAILTPETMHYDVDEALGSFGPISPEMCFWRGRLYFLDSVIGLFNKSMTKVTVLPNYIHEVAECLASTKISISRF